ncbi:hypothetical protein MFIFM68171_01764 [Madurella fahalii]|uniref:Alkyl hydroperoxide reductase subunit C/ Thiol specific antioxidant domain-containing protein n=1 Tax=Madurella fahalii TaxID=1157608 RepID=A0ABQ0G1C8_9PEZI
MFSNLAAKAALKKVGLPSDAFNFASPWDSSSNSSSGNGNGNGNGNGKAKPLRKLTKQPTPPDNNPNNTNNKSWQPEWMSIKSLPLTVQPWLTPRPPPIPVADPPRAGDLAPLDRDRQLSAFLGSGNKALVVFLRCVGCAFAQRSLVHLRTLAARHRDVACIAVSHSSPAATQKWLDLLGGAGGVRVVIDEERAVYAAWGLGLGGVWYVLHPASQVAGFKEKGWLGARVAGSLQGRGASSGSTSKGGSANGNGVVGKDIDPAEGPVTTMGNKWQETGAWAVDGRGTIVWGGKVARADEVMDLDAGVKALGVA